MLSLLNLLLAFKNPRTQFGNICKEWNESLLYYLIVVVACSGESITSSRQKTFTMALGIHKYTRIIKFLNRFSLLSCLISNPPLQNKSIAQHETRSFINQIESIPSGGENYRAYPRGPKADSDLTGGDGLDNPLLGLQLRFPWRTCDVAFNTREVHRKDR